MRPNVLITDAYSVLLPSMQRKARDEQLLTSILTTLRAKGDVLIVTDTAGRVLEIAHLLDQVRLGISTGRNAFSFSYGPLKKLVSRSTRSL